MAEFAHTVIFDANEDDPFVFKVLSDYEEVAFGAQTPDEVYELVSFTLPSNLQSEMNSQRMILAENLDIRFSPEYSQVEYDFSNIRSIVHDIYLGIGQGAIQEFASRLANLMPVETAGEAVRTVSFKGDSYYGFTLEFQGEDGSTASWTARDAEDVEELFDSLPNSLYDELQQREMYLGESAPYLVFDGDFARLAGDLHEDDVLQAIYDLYEGHTTEDVRNLADAVAHCFPSEDGLMPVDNIAFKGGYGSGFLLDIHGETRGNVYYNESDPGGMLDLFESLASRLNDDLEEEGLVLEETPRIRFEGEFEKLSRHYDDDVVCDIFFDLNDGVFTDEAEDLARAISLIME